MQIQASPSPSKVNARRKFGGYKGEEPKIVRQAKVEENQALRQMAEAFQKFNHDRYKNDAGYEKALQLVKGMDYTSADVTKFSILLADFQNEENFKEKAGLFLSALINHGTEQDYLVHVRLLDEIQYLGYKNTKNIVIEGNCGQIGNEMISGRITVIGNSGGRLGLRMKGGKIIVKGNSGSGIGEGMEGGTIIVEKDAEYNIGPSMKGGEIIIKGDAESGIGTRIWSGIPQVHFRCDNWGNLTTVHFEKVVDVVEGNGMKGGTIRIEGNIGSHIGCGMTGGKIYHKGRLLFDETAL